ncbi:hypothetical protein LZZ90_13575 [Flavobacterium sp. SM15]|uniref:hypothetical protein n=1 Tax=Flavobacterium sp. SM15 TaxID=2908005 RepID=UPI001ED9D56C|nr:hypothetical protein [Flavobacterium sp. SM15]MCG2612540.1 hypothetical protein [Flavobacterium sp. SM15]
MIRIKKSTGILKKMNLKTILGLMFKTFKTRRIKSANDLKNKKQETTPEDKKSFYDSLSNLALINETLFQSHSL